MLLVRDHRTCFVEFHTWRAEMVLHLKPVTRRTGKFRNACISDLRLDESDTCPIVHYMKRLAFELILIRAGASSSIDLVCTKINAFLNESAVLVNLANTCS